MEKTLLQKIYFILDYYKKINAKIWNLDTDIYNTWERFAKNLKENFIYKNFTYSKITIKLVEHPHNNKEKYFILLLNNINITPRKNNKEKGWAKSSLRQFLQEGIILDMFIVDIKNVFFDNATFSITPKISYFLSYEFSWKNLLMKSINYSFFSNSQYIKNFGLSMFFCFLFKKGINFKDITPPIKFSYVKTKKENYPFLSYELHCKDCAEKIYNQTYKNFIDILNNEIKLEEFVNNIYFYLRGKIELYSLKNEEIDNDFLSNFCESDYHKNKKIDYAKNLLKAERLKLRKNIIEKRSHDKKRYCDLEVNIDPLICHTDAAHIYEVKSIYCEIKEILNKNSNANESIIKGYASQASDVNNGLLMPKNAHFDFDKNIFQFDLSGNIIFLNENASRVKELGLENAKIKSEVLNDRMIEYLKRRNI